ncbi:response regulator transcription factor [Sphingomonas lycopersici]|uniref:Response regulator transcription factor n=1 Tax=Sphingomonas lycopersici TaxID=2951807 RepID=A0AA41ZJ82_9SPHN|nr:response regulator transcription factor [Sphingomonas lycopersici]MCW6530708.1 response regulator transcription factor [Sphingomonas lycopersici]MCW6536713.1 response regulator transcription factor [Sphingomonas lycopersici]
MPKYILVVEDDQTTRKHIVQALTAEGFRVDSTADGRDALYQASAGRFDAIILDRMLPSLDGMAVMAALRAVNIDTPVLILSALDKIEDRVTGLTSGAEDYLIKPFAMAELIARLHLMVDRRSLSRLEQARLTCGDLEMDLTYHKVRRGSRDIELQPREFRVLEYFLRHRDQVITRAMLLKQVWDCEFDPGTNVVEAQISRLRKKLENDGDMPLLHTIRGAGYKLGTER